MERHRARPEDHCKLDPGKFFGTQMSRVRSFAGLLTTDMCRRRQNSAKNLNSLTESQ